MQKALIALIVSALMVSAFAMTSVASAQVIITPAGKSPVEKVKIDVGDIALRSIHNFKTGHTVSHLEPGSSIGSLTGPENYNSNNPHDEGIHPAP